MAQELKLKVKGLYLHPNPLSEAPPGALSLADNIVIDRESVAESRRGFNFYSDDALDDKINRMVNFKNTLVVHYDDKLAYDSSGTFTDFTGDFSAPSSVSKIQFLEVNRSLYFTTSMGIKKLESVTTDPVRAGMVKALDRFGDPAVLGGGGFLPDGHLIAYRLVWGITDANGYLILGRPSNVSIAINSSGTSSDVTQSFLIPEGITENHVYQLYRSASLDSTLGESPSDELQLVVEDSPSAVDIAAGMVSITDSTPNSLVGAYLYTSETQEGALQTNDQPPLARDMTYFKESVFYANTIQPHRTILTLLSPDEFNTVGAKFRVSGFLYDDTPFLFSCFGSMIPAPGDGSFSVVTAFTPAENIEMTARNLVQAINLHADNGYIYAYYVSGYNDLPGRIVLEERQVGGKPFGVFLENMVPGDAFSPTLPLAAPGLLSDNEEKINRVYISKFRQPGAVPPLQYVECGSADESIQRIIALRDAVFVFKKDGIFRIAGDDIGSFVVRRFDDTVGLVAPDSAVVFDNRIFMFSDQGIVAVSDSGVEVKSRAIEKTLLELTELDNFAANTFGISYESDRKYICYTIQSAVETNPTQAFVYNTATDSWTRWTNLACAGVVRRSDNKLYLANPSNLYVYQERKDYSLDDYADEQYAVAITGSDGLQVDLDDVSECRVGYTIRQGDNFSRITEVVTVGAGPGGYALVEDQITWQADSATVYKPISLVLEYLPIIAQNPGILKQFQEVTLFFSDASFKEIEVGFASNFDPSFQYLKLPAVIYRPWGDFSWGDAPWGGNVGGFQPIRTYVDRYCSRSAWLYLRLRLSEAFRNLKFDGASIMFNPMSSRFK